MFIVDCNNKKVAPFKTGLCDGSCAAHAKNIFF